MFDSWLRPWLAKLFEMRYAGRSLAMERGARDLTAAADGFPRGFITALR